MQKANMNVNELVVLNTQAIGELTTMIGRMNDILNVTTEKIDDFKKQIKENEIKTDEIEVTVDKVKEDVGGIKDAIKQTTIDRHQRANIKNKIATRTKKFTGDKDDPKYILFYSAYRGRITNLLKKHFNVSAYEDISIDEYDEAIKLIGLLSPEDWFTEYVLDDLKTKSENGELKVSVEKALTKYLSIR